jgi:flavin-dependent dehydrogenase
MKRGLKVLAVVSLLCGLIVGGCGWWLYTRARSQADVGMGLQRRSLELYDRSDAFKGTPEEDRLIEEGQRLGAAGDETLASARSSRTWALVSGIASIVLVLASIAAMMLHLKRKEAASSS